MLGENIKLLFKLYYRPVSAISDIIDKVDWFFGAALVTATAVLLAFTVTNRIFATYESAPIPAEERKSPPTFRTQIKDPEAPPAESEETDEAVLERGLPRNKRLPLPVI